MLIKSKRQLLVCCSLTAALLFSTAPAAVAAGHPVENNGGGMGAGQVNGASGRDNVANGAAHSANAGGSETGRTSSAAGQATAADNRANAVEKPGVGESKADAGDNKARRQDTTENARTVGGNRGSGRSGGTDARSTTRSGPPGNNGTIKIDGVEFDSHPNNEPHVDCMFEIDFYGFDANQAVTVDFALQAPTTGSAITGTSPSGATLDGDDNSSGGSELGLDGSLSYTLSFSGVTPHPEQGYHVKLTVHAPGAKGADTKHKVFWVEPCATAGPALVIPPAATATPGDGEVVQNQAAATNSETSRLNVLGVIIERIRAAGVGVSLRAAGSPVAGINAGNTARVLGLTVERGALPRTGLDVFQLMTLAALALLAGTAAVRVSRRKASEAAFIAV